MREPHLQQDFLWAFLQVLGELQKVLQLFLLRRRTAAERALLEFLATWVSPWKCLFQSPSFANPGYGDSTSGRCLQEAQQTLTDPKDAWIPQLACNLELHL